jgi:hypothetical protein
MTFQFVVVVSFVSIAVSCLHRVYFVQDQWASQSMDLNANIARQQNVQVGGQWPSHAGNDQSYPSAGTGQPHPSAGRRGVGNGQSHPSFGVGQSHPSPLPIPSDNHGAGNGFSHLGAGNGFSHLGAGSSQSHPSARNGQWPPNAGSNQEATAADYEVDISRLQDRMQPSSPY